MEIAPPQIRLKLGQVVHSKYGEKWVFVGYRFSTKSTSLAFVCGTTTSLHKHHKDYFAYGRQALTRKFPDIIQYEIPDDQN